jgi:hypothetical protein
MSNIADEFRAFAIELREDAKDEFLVDVPVPVDKLASLVDNIADVVVSYETKIANLRAALLSLVNAVENDEVVPTDATWDALAVARALLGIEPAGFDAQDNG